MTRERNFFLLTGIALGGFGAAIYAGLERDDPGAFASTPFTSRAYVVYASPGAEATAKNIAASIRLHGGKARVETDSNAHVGAWVAPSGPESEAIAWAIKPMFGTVIVDDYKVGEKAYGTPYQIGVGLRETK